MERSLEKNKYEKPSKSIEAVDRDFSSFLSGEPTAIVTQWKVVFFKGTVFPLRILSSTEALKKMRSL